MNAQVTASTRIGPARAQSVAHVASDLVSARAEEVALDRAELRVDRGQLVTVVGAPEPTAALFGLLTGFPNLAGDRQEAGSVQVGVQDIGMLDPEALTTFRRRNIGLVFSTINLIPTLSARDNVLFAARAAGVDTSSDHADSLLALGQIPDVDVRDLTAPQAQIVACSRALALQAPIVIARDPLAVLDEAGADQVAAFLRDSAHQLNQGILVIETNAQQVRQADHALFLDQGKVLPAVIHDAPSAYTTAPVRPAPPPTRTPIPTPARSSEETHGEELFPLRNVLEEIAPTRPFTQVQQRLLDHAQEILGSLPGPVMSPRTDVDSDEGSD